MTDRDAAVDAVISVAKNFDSCFDGKVADDCPESTYLCSHWEAAVRAAVEQYGQDAEIAALRRALWAIGTANEDQADPYSAVVSVLQEAERQRGD